MMLSEKLTRKPCTTSSSYRLLFLVLMAGLALAMAFSMVFAGDAEAKKKKKKKKKRTPARSAIAAPGTTSPHPADVYSGEHVVRAWGFNQFGQLGDETYTERNTPVQVKNLSGVKAMAAGQVHSLALKEDGTVWAWGANGDGQLGDGGTNYRGATLPVQVKNLSNVKAVAGGDYHSLALKEDGTVWAWGGNLYGQLGTGTSSRTPIQVSNLSGVKAIASRGYHSLALKEDGTVWAWGRNDRGQLGDGTTTDRHTPVQVKGEPPTNAPASSSAAFFPWNDFSGVKAIATGGYHSLALKEDGTVFAWGSNDSGRLGDGTTTERHTPVQVQNLQGVRAIASGWPHSLALKEDGTVWAWGHNYSGQLGDGTTTNRHTPVQVQNLGGVKAIASGNLHNLALKTDDTVFAWGRNYGGELGDGSSGNHRYTPVQVKNLQGVQAITAGGYHNLAKVLNPPVVAPQ